MNKLEKFLVGTYENGGFNDVLKKFLKKKEKQDLSISALSHLFRSLEPLGRGLEDKSVRSITKAELKNYDKQLKLKYSPGTIRPIIGDIQQFFCWCKKKSLIKKNISKCLKKPRVRPSQKKAAPESDALSVIRNLVGKLSTSDLIYRDLFSVLQVNESKAWHYAELKYLHDLFAIVFLYETGCRAGELTNLSTIAMNRTTKEPRSTYMVTSWGKTADRDLRFTNASAELWRCWNHIRPHNLPIAIYGWRAGAFPTQYETNGLSQMVARRCQEAKVKPFRSHALRHAKVKRSRKLVGIEIAQQLVDHSDITTTYGYANIDDIELQEAVLKTGLTHDLWLQKQ